MTKKDLEVIRGVIREEIIRGAKENQAHAENRSKEENCAWKVFYRKTERLRGAGYNPKTKSIEVR